MFGLFIWQLPGKLGTRALPGESSRDWNPCPFLSWFSVASLLLLLTYLLPWQSAQTLCWAVAEASKKSCFPLSTTSPFFQTGAVQFLWHWSDLINPKSRLAHLPLSLCTAGVWLRCLCLWVISSVGWFLGVFLLNEGYVLKACFTLL